jgi:hypothetical protein
MKPSMYLFFFFFLPRLLIFSRMTDLHDFSIDSINNWLDETDKGLVSLLSRWAMETMVFSGEAAA